MLARVRTQRDVDYIVVSKLSRMARNRLDDTMVMADLDQIGAGQGGLGERGGEVGALSGWIAVAGCLENHVRHARAVAELLDQPGLADPSAAGNDRGLIRGLSRSRRGPGETACSAAQDD